MLTEERYAHILEEVQREGSATVSDLMGKLGASESTIRRDLNAMDAKGLLTKVHGGAIAIASGISTKDEEVNNRKSLNRDEKITIARYAASLIKDTDFVYLDAGTTTELLIDYIKSTKAVFVTNAFSHAKKLAEKGLTVYILGGEFKTATEAIVGEEAVISLDKYNFTKGFWGANGVSMKQGFTTPEVKEAMVKRKSMENCKERYVLVDHEKFSTISSVKFADFEDAIIITDSVLKKELKGYKNVKEAK